MKAGAAHVSMCVVLCVARSCLTSFASRTSWARLHRRDTCPALGEGLCACALCPSPSHACACSATGFTTRSDIGPAKDADYDTSCVCLRPCTLAVQALPHVLLHTETRRRSLLPHRSPRTRMTPRTWAMQTTMSLLDTPAACSPQHSTTPTTRKLMKSTRPSTPDRCVWLQVRVGLLRHASIATGRAAQAVSGGGGPGGHAQVQKGAT